MAERELVRCRDLGELSRRAAEDFIRLAESCVRDSGRFTAALSGGSTPQSFYKLLAHPGYAERVPWKDVHFFWGDERCVPPEHPESNYGVAAAGLLSKIPIPDANVRRMAGEKEPRLAAAEYESTLIQFFSSKDGEWPRFDLMLLGIGEDGHTASLFPNSDALENRENLVVAPYVEKLKAHRLTLTLPVINHAANIWFFVSGASKAGILAQIFNAELDATRIPATLVEPIHRPMRWFVTEDAGSGLPPQKDPLAI